MSKMAKVAGPPLLSVRSNISVKWLSPNATVYNQGLNVQLILTRIVFSCKLGITWNSQAN